MLAALNELDLLAAPTVPKRTMPRESLFQSGKGAWRRRREVGGDHPGDIRFEIFWCSLASDVRRSALVEATSGCDRQPSQMERITMSTSWYMLMIYWSFLTAPALLWTGSDSLSISRRDPTKRRRNTWEPTSVAIRSKGTQSQSGQWVPNDISRTR
jgi:hypothetical protein